jgi:SAM-dependent methyltransferase
MSLNELHFPDSYFDVVFSQNVLEHVHGLEQAWAEMKRVLKPGGTFFCHFGPLWSHSFGHHWYSETDDSFSSPVPPYGHLSLTRTELLQLARSGTKVFTPERAAAKEYLLGGACNKLFPSDYRRIFRDNPDFQLAEWVEVREHHHNRPVPDGVLRKYPDVRREDFDVSAIWIKGTKVGGRPGLAPDVRKRASHPSRPSLLQRLVRKPRKLWSRV